MKPLILFVLLAATTLAQYPPPFCPPMCPTPPDQRAKPKIEKRQLKGKVKKVVK